MEEIINISRQKVVIKRTDGLRCQISFECFVADMKMSVGTTTNKLEAYIVTRYTFVSSTNPVRQLKFKR